MIDYMEIGPTPSDEECAQVGSEGYEVRARAECERFIALIRKTVGEEPNGAKLVVKRSPHDFGTYYEVAVKFASDIPEAVEYAYLVERMAPDSWDEDKK